MERVFGKKKSCNLVYRYNFIPKSLKVRVLLLECLSECMCMPVHTVKNSYIKRFLASIVNPMNFDHENTEYHTSLSRSFCKV